MMLRLSLAARFVAVALLLYGCARLSGPPDLPSAKRAVAAYMEGNGYQRDLRKALAPAWRDLATLPDGGTAKVAVVLDIDDTALSTYEYQKGMGFGHYTPAWHEWQRQRRAVALAPVLAVFTAARAKGVAVFFISGRRELSRADTEASLRAAGYDGWAEVMLKPDAHREPSVAPFKTACREQIEGRGYRILLNIGDQAADLQGGHAERTIKLPNPIYRAP